MLFTQRSPPGAMLQKAAIPGFVLRLCFVSVSVFTSHGLL